MLATRPTLGARRSEFRAGGHWNGALIDTHLSGAAQERPDAVAIVDGRQRLTYAQTEASVSTIAANLARLGVRPGEVVSWQLPNWHEALLLHYAVLRLGAVSNPIIPIYRAHEVGYILAQAGSRVVIVPESFRGFDYPAMLAELRPGLPRLEHVLIARPDGDVAAPAAPFASLLADAPPIVPPARSAEDPVLLMFTSGTTAQPKGVLHTHNTLEYENRSIIDVYGLSGTDVVFMPSPLTHITGMLYGIQLPAMLAATVVLMDVWDPTRALALIEAERCTFTLAATPFLHGLVHHPELDSYDVSSLRVFACGGADVPPALIRQAGERLGVTGTRVYGSTEFPTLSTSSPDAPEDKRAGTDGAVIAAAEFRLVDEHDQPVPAGTVGDLLVRGPELFQGYLAEADNAGAFTEDGFFRTGDLAAVDPEGYLSIRGRKKDIVLRGGENISVTEVEELLFEHPAVAEVAVVAMPDPTMVERACAFVVLAPGRSTSLPELVAFLDARRIARQKYPERLEFLDAMPKTQSGKIQKFRLRELIRERLTAESQAARV